MTLVLLGAAEAASLLLVFCLYRAATKPDVSSFLYSSTGIICLGSVITIMASMGWIVRSVRRSDALARKRMMMAFGLSLLIAASLFLSMEISVRFFSKQTARGLMVLGVLLEPRDWEAFRAEHEAVLENLTQGRGYLVHDRILGWTVAPSQSNKADREASSEEGLRSPLTGMSFADPRTRHAGPSMYPASVRVALIGDSMTFGYEVRCEETWAHALEGFLQPDAQVLNFGVSAYGVNQAYLRYAKDVRGWHPDLVIVGITSEMVRRINSVYPFLMNREWGTFPFARPRLVEREGVPFAINSPVPPPQKIFSYAAIAELPSLHLDDYYDPLLWGRGGAWAVIEKSYAFRFVNSLRPPARVQSTDTVGHATLMSRFVVQNLVRTIAADGSIPLVVWLPYRSEIQKLSEPAATEPALAVRMLREAGISYYDATDCLIDAGLSEAYTDGGHYSPKANARLAHCLAPVVQGALIENKRSHSAPDASISGKAAARR
ncbi:MAG TPA: SGNH/GDSL hydrolase family protein [Nitrospira sp.]|nr:SGNH/GDSL hydrolase family protein [Nitrospira sp.]